MEKYKPTISFVLDKRVQKKSGKFPLKLKVYCNPTGRLYKTNIDVTPEEYKKVKSDKLRDEGLKELRFKKNSVQSKAEKIIEDLIPFSFKKFEDIFFENATDLKGLNLSNLFDAYVTSNKNKMSVSTVISYQTAINSLSEFKKDLSLFDITPELLQEYEEFMLNKKKSRTTIGFYLRNLRSIYNDSISRNLISNDNYPFGKNKYRIPVGSNTKKALSDDEITKLFNHIPNNIDEQQALDFWKLSFLCNGMNFCDILRIKTDDLKGDFFTFIRSKTKNTRKGSQQEIKVRILPASWEIINKWKSSRPNSLYLFPFLKEEHTPIQEKYFIQDFIKKNNKHMETIRKALGIEQKCNTYSCRHSFATFYKRKLVPIEFISESLGHSNVATTTAYLASFDDKTIIEYSNLLNSF